MCELTLRAANMGRVTKLEHRGYRFDVHVMQDDGMRAPWIEHDGHGVIIQMDRATSDPPRGAKHMAVDYWYDWRATQVIAKRDQWGLNPDDRHALAKRLGREPNACEVLNEAIQRDFDYCRDWLLDRWEWVLLGVYLTDVTGHHVPGKTGFLGGLDSSDTDFLNEQAVELADEIIDTLDGADTVTLKLR